MGNIVHTEMFALKPIHHFKGENKKDTTHNKPLKFPNIKDSAKILKEVILHEL